MRYKIINQVTGEEFKTKKEITALLEDFEDRGKLFRLAELFSDDLYDLKIVKI